MGVGSPGVQFVGTDESGDVDVDPYDFTGPRVVVIGNETRGLSSGWREACDRTVRIPIDRRRQFVERRRRGDRRAVRGRAAAPFYPFTVRIGFSSTTGSATPAVRRLSTTGPTSL